jgi:predicted small secreted protein
VADRDECVSRVVAVALCLLLAGCGTAPSAGSDDRPTAATVTPAPVPDQPTAATDAVSPAVALAAEPTCERLPERVVAIQLAALRAENRTAGVETAWRFTAPASRQRVGSLSTFRDLLETAYGELLNATKVAYGPVIVIDDEAQREVQARSADGDSTVFRWVLERQRGGRYDSCWMTTRITRERDREAGPNR